MVLVNNLVLVVAIAAALQLVAADLRYLCDDLNRAMNEDESVLADGERAFVFANRWLTARTSALSNERKLIKAWENVHKGECSSSSWDHLDLLVNCKRPSTLSVLDEPIKAYAKKCLKPEYVSKKIKSETNRMFSTDVDFVDATFIKKFYEDNPNDIPLHVDWVGDHYWFWSPRPMRDTDCNCCRAKRSYGAVNNAIERDLAKQGKDPKKVFYADPTAVEKYLEKRLFKPCRLFASSYEYLASQLGNVTEYYEGGQSALIAMLDQGTKNILFRYKYCEMLERDKKLVIAAASRTFV